MNAYKQLKTAADKLDAMASDLEAAHKAKLAAQKDAATKLAAAKTAAAKPTIDPKVAEQAKVAADKLRSAGLISSADNANHFASEVANSHELALKQLAKIAEHVKAPRTARVVVDQVKTAESADSMWEARLARAPRLTR